MTDARAMPWSEARPWIAGLVNEVDDNPFLRMDKRCVAALDAAIALGDRCAQVEARLAELEARIRELYEVSPTASDFLP